MLRPSVAPGICQFRTLRQAPIPRAMYPLPTARTPHLHAPDAPAPMARRQIASAGSNAPLFTFQPPGRKRWSRSSSDGIRSARHPSCSSTGHADDALSPKP